MSDLLFVYGTLRRGFANPHADFLAQHSRFLGMASIPGTLFLLGGSAQDGFSYPGAVWDSASTQRVTGELLQLHDPSLCFRLLDHYEGVGEEFGEPQAYVRQIIPVRREEDGSEVPCWCYLWNLPVSGLPKIPGGDFAAIGSRK
ncbi:MAG: gamma-glutamylcyclotransferase [Verrucomicrobiales bacterium]|nr:gamma-glutamylcyclotransferase [Verrucomicrobiales bacterium]